MKNNPDIMFQTTEDFIKEWKEKQAKKSKEEKKTPSGIEDKKERMPKKIKEPSRFSGKQRKILIAGIVIVFLMGLFPPWLYTYKASTFYSENSAGYHFIIVGPPNPNAPLSGIKIDFSRLFLQCLLVVIATGLGIYLSKRTDGKLE